MKITESLRLAQVKRYPICYTNRDQSVAEHSFNVMLIAQELVKEHDDPDLYLKVLGYALTHDMDEVETGDIPSPFKRKLREKCPEVIPILDGEPKVDDTVRQVVKLADYLESIHYIREFGGSRYTANEILADIYAQFSLAMHSSTLPRTIVERAKWLAGTL